MDALLDKIILIGGHIKVGLGDYPYLEDGCPTNATVVANIARRANELGRPVASPGDTRKILQLPNR